VYNRIALKQKSLLYITKYNTAAGRKTAIDSVRAAPTVGTALFPQKWLRNTTKMYIIINQAFLVLKNAGMHIMEKTIPKK
jgi:hypothetical protein